MSSRGNKSPFTCVAELINKAGLRKCISNESVLSRCRGEWFGVDARRTFIGIPLFVATETLESRPARLLFSRHRQRYHLKIENLATGMEPRKADMGR